LKIDGAIAISARWTWLKRHVGWIRAMKARQIDTAPKADRIGRGAYAYFGGSIVLVLVSVVGEGFDRHTIDLASGDAADWLATRIGALGPIFSSAGASGLLGVAAVALPSALLCTVRALCVPLLGWGCRRCQGRFRERAGDA
jgi:hypothetical protein